MYLVYVYTDLVQQETVETKYTLYSGQNVMWLSFILPTVVILILIWYVR